MSDAARRFRGWASGLLVGLVVAAPAGACPPVPLANGQEVRARFESGKVVTARRDGPFVEAMWEEGNRRHVAKRWFGLVDQDHTVAAPDGSATYYRTVLAGDPAHALALKPGKSVALTGTQEVLQVASLVPLDPSTARVVGRFAMEISIQTGPATVFEVGGCRYDGLVVESIVRAPQVDWRQVSRLSFVPALGMVVASSVREGRGDDLKEKEDRVVELLP